MTAASSLAAVQAGNGDKFWQDKANNLVWFKQLTGPDVAANLQIQKFRGRKVLTWWQGGVTPSAFGIGKGVIANRKYQTIRTVHAGNGYDMDIHEFTLTPGGDALFTVYVPIMQSPYSGLSILVRTNAAPATLAAPLRAIVRELDHEVPVYSVQTMEERVVGSVGSQRFYAMLIAIFAAVALVLSAVGLYVQFWFPTMPTWATVLIALAVVLFINLLSARAFGEFEFWASILKVAAIVVFLIVGLIVVVFKLDIGGHQAGIQNLWSNPGGFWPSEDPFHWYGPILVMSGVVFAYAAIEMVAIAAGEMKDSDKEVPKAINAVIFRIAVFYCGSILLIVCMLPTSEFKSGISPFVTIFDRMGLDWMAAAIQAILIVAAMSSLNSGLYSTGRVLRSDIATARGYRNRYAT